MKNQFYLFILIASLAVCGVVMFRPQTADRVLGLLGLQDKAATTYTASEWDGLSANPTVNPVPIADAAALNSIPTFGNALPYNNASFGNDADGFAVTSAGASSSQAMPPVSQQVPMFGEISIEPAGQYGNQYGNTLDEGVAVSGANSNSYNGAEPDFSSFPAVPSGTPISGFEGYNPNVTPPAPSPSLSEMTIQFGGSAIPNPTPTPATGYDLNMAVGVQPLPTNQMVSDNNDTFVGFANFTPPPQPGEQPNTLPSGMSFDGNTTMSDASIVMPDPPYSGFSGFGDLMPMAMSELDARIIPPPPSPAGSPSIPWGTPTNPQTVGIAQPVMTQEQYASSEHAVVPVQGVMPPTTAVPQFQVPQFETPQFPTPQSAPPMRETVLYVPPHGNAGQVQPMQPQPIVQQQPQPMQPQPVPPPQNQRPQQEPVAIASATRHDLPVTDMRAQYVQEDITQIETVFATEMLARVGSRHVIMTCDILAELREIVDGEWAVKYREVFEDYGQQPTPADERIFKADAMQQLFEHTLNNAIMLQTLYLDLTMCVPAEQIEAFEQAESRNFDMVTIPEMMEQYGVTNRYELDRELRKFGTTLQHKKESMLQQKLAMGWFGERVHPQKSMPTRDDLINYYEQHKDERYKILGFARWEELAILFSKCANEEEARVKIAELGNRVQKGEPFAEVAIQGSQGSSAYRGGERDTLIDSLVTKNLEKAVFTLPIGKMSTIIQEDTGGSNAGFYIVRVLERQDTHYTSFDRVQSEIQKAILEERFQKEQQRVFAEIQKKYPVSKTNNLQQIILMASEAERNLPPDDSPDYHARLMAKAERLEPSKKTNTDNSNDRQDQTSVATATSYSAASQSHVTLQPGQEPIRIAAVTDGSGRQNTTSLSVRQADAGAPARRVDSPNTTVEPPPKKKTFLQSLNPFK